MTALVAPDLQRSFCICADWAELVALARPGSVATDRDILHPNDLLEDRAAPTPRDLLVSGAPADDPDIVDATSEYVLDLVFEELARRKQVLGDAYPFETSFSRRSFRLEEAQETGQPLIEQGRAIYRACLYMSAIRAGSLRIVGAPPDPQLGNLFHICATIAAAGYVNGDAYWFGHPRPDGTTLYEALSNVASHLGHGEAVTARPTGETITAKDVGVDVVAWRNHRDERPSKLILYGQCASGMNWEGKPVKTKVDRLNAHYFTVAPSQYWLPAIFTPFPLYMDKENTHRLRDSPTISAFYGQTETEMGIIIDRLRLVHWAMLCLSDVQPCVRTAVERLSDLFAWSDNMRQATGLGA